VPTFRRLSTEEIAAQRPQGSRPPVDLSLYLAFLRDFSSGEIGEITLGETETQRVIKHRLTMAALAASLAAFDLGWPFPMDCWRVGHMAIRPSQTSYAEAHRAVAVGRYAVRIACEVTMGMLGQQVETSGAITLLLRPDHLPHRSVGTTGEADSAPSNGLRVQATAVPQGSASTATPPAE
jgi:hypothetical protein